MLLRFRVSNHASLRDEQELSLIADKEQTARAEQPVPRSGHRVVPVAAVYGPNASGKSNVIDAIAWMRAAVLSSFRSWDPSGGVPRRPFAFRRNAAEHPSVFEVEFVMDGVRYDYGFTVDDDRIREEWLYSYPEGKQRRLFERLGEDPIAFGRGLTGRRKVIAELLRPNSLYLSVAAAQGHELLRRIYGWFRHGLGVATDGDFHKRLDSTIGLFLEDGAQGLQPLLGFLRFADLGVSGLEVREPEEGVDAERQRIVEAIRGIVGDRARIEETGSSRVLVTHTTEEGVYELDLAHESSGTRTWIGLLGPVLITLAQGSVLCVDELDARLHPYLSDALVGMFQSPKINTRGAQLVFSTHEASLLGRSSRTELMRDQVWFTEMEAGSRATRLFPLTDFQVRDATDNLERRYLQGRYGALPYIDEDLIASLAGGGSAGTSEHVAGPDEGQSSGAA
ncbi:ATP-binding protein [Streptomyces sp. NPDC047097]|uniref:AAA family ATPase n=1 Tax=Streptomyces sp. NPDC047097 TaxID=3155260 RepID=UPI0033D90ED7